MKIHSASLLFVDVSSMVLKINDGTIVLKISIGNNLKWRKALAEYYTSPLEGVVELKAYCFQEKGVSFRSLFETEEEHAKFLKLYRKDELNRGYVTQMIQRMKTQPTLLLVQEAMDGSLDDFPLCEREKMKDRLQDLFYSVFKKQSERYFKDYYLIHGDLYPRNILYKYEGDNLILKVTDFGKSYFTKDVDQLKESIATGLKCITESHKSSKRPLASTFTGHSRSRRRFN